MFFDLSNSVDERSYKILTGVIVPRPIAWVVTVNENGEANAAPFSFFNVISTDPPLVALGIGNRDGARKDSKRNIQRTGEFVINMVPESLASAMNITAIDYPDHVNELTQANLKTLPSENIAVPRIELSPVALECRLWKEIETGPQKSILIGQVVGVHVAEHAIINAEKGYIDAAQLKLISRLHGSGWYSRTTDNFVMRRLSKHDTE